MLLVSIITCFYFLYNFREEEDVPLLIPEEVRRTLEYLSNKHLTSHDDTDQTIVCLINNLHSKY
jgi:hypothetical protein